MKIEEIITAVFTIFIVIILISALAPVLSEINPQSGSIFTVAVIFLLVSFIASLLKK